MSLKPAPANLSIWRGATFRLTFTIYQNSTTGPVLVLTGYTARMTIRDVNRNTLLTLSTENNGVILDEDNGKITLRITDEDTAALTWETARYELFLTEPGGDTDILLYGRITVTGDG